MQSHEIGAFPTSSASRQLRQEGQGDIAEAHNEASPFLAVPTGWQSRQQQCGDREKAGDKVESVSASPDLEKHICSPSLSWTARLNASWKLEAIGLVLSAVTLVAMVIVLRKYNGQMRPALGILSLNSVISVLSTASKMTALFGTTSALSQMKWTWFTKQRRHTLADFRTFDTGSKGLSGAASLIWFLKFRHLAVLGALAIILGVAADPFAQQIIRYYQADFVDDSQSAWVTRASDYNAYTSLSLDAYVADPALVANTVTALYQAPQEKLVQPSFSCGTGNCIWPRFTTLAFCPVCVDISSSLNKTYTDASTCTVALPDIGLYTSYYNSPFYMVLNRTSPDKAIVLKNATWPFLVYQSIHAVVDPFSVGNGSGLLSNDTRFIGTECSLSPCVLSMEASVDKGSYTENILDRWMQVDTEDGNYDPVAGGEMPIEILRPSWGPEEGMQAGQTFNISYEASEALSHNTDGSTDSNAVGDQLRGTVYTSDALSGVTFGGNTALQALFYANFTNTTCPTPQDNVACSFRALAAGVTKAIRDARLAEGISPSSTMMGSVMVTGTFVRVEWAWLALPITVWLLSIITVVAAILGSSDVPLWKGNILPLAFLYREDGTVDGSRWHGISDLEVRTRADTLKVRLVVDQGGTMRLVTDSSV